jgi:hypothetical protein
MAVELSGCTFTLEGSFLDWPVLRCVDGGVTAGHNQMASPPSTVHTVFFSEYGLQYELAWAGRPET